MIAKRIFLVILSSMVIASMLIGCGTEKKADTKSEVTGKSELDLEATDEANIRAAIAGLTTSLLSEGITEEEIKKNDTDGIVYGVYEDGSGLFAEVTATQKQDGWQNASEQASNTGKEVGGVFVTASTIGWRLTASLTDRNLPIMANTLN